MKMAHRQVVGVENTGGKHMAKQLDCTIRIASTHNNGVHGIHFSQHTTFNMLNPLAREPKGGLISICGVDWTTSKSNHFNQQMPQESSSLKTILGSVR